MATPQNPWELTDAEWQALRHILEDVAAGQASRSRGRPTFGDTRAIAEACLFRSFHSLSTGRNHTFDWNALPEEFGVSPSTANRRFRSWHASGSWPRFWAELHKLRAPKARIRPQRPRRDSRFPVSDVITELQRAYRFFNEVLFGGVLPDGLAITLLRGEGPGNRLGFFCGRAWAWGTDRPVDLIAISGIAVGRGPEVALETLIHEMVHHRNHGYGLVDCTNRGLYHNRHFRDAAVLAGLACGGCDKNHGYGFTSLGERARWAIARLRPKTHLFRTAEPTEPPGPGIGEDG